MQHNDSRERAYKAFMACLASTVRTLDNARMSSPADFLDALQLEMEHLQSLDLSHPETEEIENIVELFVQTVLHHTFDS